MSWRRLNVSRTDTTLTTVTSNLNAGWQLSTWCNSRCSGDVLSKTGEKNSPADSILLKTTCSNRQVLLSVLGDGSKCSKIEVFLIIFTEGQPFEPCLFIWNGNGFSFGDFGICYCVFSACRCKAIYMLMWIRYTVVFVCFERIYRNVAPISTSSTDCTGGECFTLKIYKGRDLLCFI